jgi:hypothetical protein
MASVFRAQSIYWNGKKVAEVSGSTFDLNANSANQYGTEGVLGQSRGAQETKLSMDTVVPTQGHEIGFLLGLVNEETVTVSVLVDAHLCNVEGTLVSLSYTGKSKEGESTCKVEFIGGAATLT